MHCASIVLALLAALRAGGYEFSHIFSRFASTSNDNNASTIIVLFTQSISYREDQRLVLFYKIINGLASVETEDILTPADSRTRKNHSFKFKHLQANCDSYRYSFFPATISSWNNLPFGIEKVDSVEGFKLKLNLRPPTGFRLQKLQIFLFFFIVVICLLTSLKHNPKISNPQVISKVV